MFHQFYVKLTHCLLDSPHFVLIFYLQAEESQKKRKIQEGSDKGDWRLCSAQASAQLQDAAVSSSTNSLFVFVLSSVSSGAPSLLPGIFQHSPSALLWHYHPRPKTCPAESCRGPSHSLDRSHDPEGTHYIIFFPLQNLPGLSFAIYDSNHTKKILLLPHRPSTW